MSNTILTTLASINATIVGIIFAVVVAFFIYSYQVLTQVKEQLTDLRITTAKIMNMPVYYQAGSINYSDYVSEDGTLDYDRIRHELFDISPVTIPEGIRQRIINSGIELASTQDEIKTRATHFLDIINLLSVSYPYSEKSKIDKKSVALSLEPKRLEYDAKWQNDLISLNGYLAWIWRGRKDEIMKLMYDYKKLDRDERAQRLEAESQKIVQAFQKGGQNITAEEAKLRLQPFEYSIDFEKIVSSFFDRVNMVEANVVPQVKDLSYKLNVFQEKFEVKKYVVLSLVFAVFILVVGVFLPMFVHLYFKSPHIRAVEVTLLASTMLPYLVIIIMFLKKALAIEFK